MTSRFVQSPSVPPLTIGRHLSFPKDVFIDSRQASAMLFSSPRKLLYDSWNRLLAFESLIGFASDVRGGAASLGEEAGEDRLDERSEDDLGSIGHGEGHPQDQDELEHIVEGEPVDGIDDTLKNREEGVDNPVCQPLGVINLGGTEQCLQRVVSRNHESSKVDEEFAADVKEDKEEVETDQAEEGIDLGDAGLFLEVVEDRVLGELLIDLRDLVLGFILERHVDGRSGILGARIVVLRCGVNYTI